MTDNDESDEAVTLSERVIEGILTRVGIALDSPVERAEVDLPEPLADGVEEDPMRALVVAADQSGILLNEISLTDANQAAAFVAARYPVIFANADNSFTVLEKISGRKVEASTISASVEWQVLSRRQIRKLLNSSPPPRIFVAKNELDCDTISAAPSRRGRVHKVSNHSTGSRHGHAGHDNGHHSSGGHGHIPPIERFIGLLILDRRDLWTVVLFALVAGVLSLAIPLAIESLVNVVSWGTYLQPLVILALMLFTCLGLAGVLQVLQSVVVEMIQRRQFVRIISDFAHRFPRANQVHLQGEYPRELANRIFDIMTIQKATAFLLLDGVLIVLTTILGLILLSFYHPFLLGFALVLVIVMLVITWVLGRGGIRTSIDESISKYRVAHWLQDVLSFPSVFKVSGGELLAIQRANQLTTAYLTARSKQFHIVIRQVAFAISLQVVSLTAVLGLGGWLVIQGELTLGQLVATELVVTAVVGAFSKVGKSLEKFYDLMAGVDKVGHLLDIPAEPHTTLGKIPDGPAEVRWSDLVYHSVASHSKIAATSIAAGARVAIVGNDVAGRSLLAQTLAGLVEPNQGLVQIAGYDSSQAATGGLGRLIGYAGERDVFHGTLRENIDLRRTGVGNSRVREVLQQVGLSEVVMRLPDDLQTHLQTKGYPLSKVQVSQLVLARAIATGPKLLIIDGLLDELPGELRSSLWQVLSASDAPWTLIITTNRADVAELCDRAIEVSC